MPSTGFTNRSLIVIMSCWRCTAPLGAPVEPEVKPQKQMSSLLVGSASKRDDALATTDSKETARPLGLPTTTTAFKGAGLFQIGSNSGRTDSWMIAAFARLSFKRYS